MPTNDPPVADLKEVEMKHPICMTPDTGSSLQKAMGKMKSHAGARTVSTVGLLFLCVSISQAQAIRQDAGTKILIPSSSRTATFTSLLAVINLDSQSNDVTITARQSDGTRLGTPISTTIRGPLSKHGHFG